MPKEMTPWDSGLSMGNEDCVILSIFTQITMSNLLSEYPQCWGVQLAMAHAKEEACRVVSLIYDSRIPASNLSVERCLHRLLF
jgi:hypothetical protein